MKLRPAKAVPRFSAILFILVIFGAGAAFGDPEGPMTGMPMAGPAALSASPGGMGSGGGMMGKGMMGKGMMGRGMMGGGRGMGMGRGRDGMSEMMGPFHRWIRGVMAHRASLGLSRDQIQKMDRLVTTHVSESLRQQGEVRALKAETAYLFRTLPLDTAKMEKNLKKTSDLLLDMQMKGIKTYQAVLDLLTQDQKDRLFSQGMMSPYPPPWGGWGDEPEDEDEETPDPEEASGHH